VSPDDELVEVDEVGGVVDEGSREPPREGPLVLPPLPLEPRGTA
jgi:hypothetical protein